MELHSPWLYPPFPKGGRGNFGEPGAPRPSLDTDIQTLYSNKHPPHPNPPPRGEGREGVILVAA